MQFKGMLVHMFTDFFLLLTYKNVKKKQIFQVVCMYILKLIYKHMCFLLVAIIVYSNIELE